MPTTRTAHAIVDFPTTTFANRGTRTRFSRVPVIPTFDQGYDAGYADGYADGFADGEAAHASDYASGFAAGEAAHASDFSDGQNSSPDIAITGTPDVSSTDDSATFVFTTTYGAMEYSLDGSSYVAAVSPLSLVDLDVGSHTLTIRSTSTPSHAQSFTWEVLAPVVVDSTAPTITVVSPTPGVAPGAPGGFPARMTDAATTPIVLRITDLDPGTQYICVVVRYYVDAEDSNPTEEVVFRRSQFRGNYVRGSSYSEIDDGLELTILRAGGWPETVIGNATSRPYIVFAVDAVDADGNLAA